MTVIDVLLRREASAEAAVCIREAMALTYFHEQDAIAFPEILITDAAPQYEHLALYHALCWIHDGRHYEKLAPSVRTIAFCFSIASRTPI